MKGLRRTLIDGAMVVLPIGAIILLVSAIVDKLERAAEPLAGRFLHPAIGALVLLVLLCLFVGLLVRSRVGRRAQRGLEASLFEKLPGYRLVKAFAGEDGPWAEGGRTMRPALAAMGDGQRPALVMDEFADGRLVVFVPGSPAAMSGLISIFSPDRITLLDVPLVPFMKAIASWGLGLKDMVDAKR
jgi:uncharacterized membrane protein